MQSYTDRVGNVGKIVEGLPFNRVEGPPFGIKVAVHTNVRSLLSRRGHN